MGKKKKTFFFFLLNNFLLNRNKIFVFCFRELLIGGLEAGGWGGMHPPPAAAAPGSACGHRYAHLRDRPGPWEPRGKVRTAEGAFRGGPEGAPAGGQDGRKAHRHCGSNLRGVMASRGDWLRCAQPAARGPQDQK